MSVSTPITRLFPVLVVASTLVGAAAPPSPQTPTVLVEMFTSQGCSSCPPADRLLSDLQERLGSAVEVVPLAFHVDYWNRLGWRDPFSAAEYSDRQRQYAQWMRNGRVYTPQVVVGGREHCVGSDLDCIRRVVTERSRVRSEARIEKLQVATRENDVDVAVQVGTERWEGQRRLLLAVRQRGLETAVRSGENARRTLHNDFVVRELAVMAELAGDGSSQRLEHRLVLDPSWEREQLDLVVFLQDPRDGSIGAVGRGSLDG